MNGGRLKETESLQGNRFGEEWTEWAENRTMEPGHQPSLNRRRRGKEGRGGTGTRTVLYCTGSLSECRRPTSQQEENLELLHSNSATNYNQQATNGLGNNCQVHIHFSPFHLSKAGGALGQGHEELELVRGLGWLGRLYGVQYIAPTHQNPIRHTNKHTRFYDFPCLPVLFPRSQCPLDFPDSAISMARTYCNS